MNIVWLYLDKKTATVNAIKDFDKMKKYIAVIDLDSLPDPPRPFKKEAKSEEIATKQGKGKKAQERGEAV